MIRKAHDESEAGWRASVKGQTIWQVVSVERENNESIITRQVRSNEGVEEQEMRCHNKSMG